ncbi:hypothetical protein M3P19_11820 [Muricauda sp. 2012CJ35-5]|uniref:Uncharacterized protein n=1 Tax=Flagellimonas spongiicola TaxID=2942208 RepID=A0ABT0PTI6_9FLAO|nr:hypothetical protein [Allomuricauda spongiicola]MCL6274700.1 hypothetical protein [Allomuricauda spongiicola]
MRKLLGLFILGLGLTSCELFMSTQEKTDKLVHDELIKVNWNEVDSYPLFVGECDELAIKEVQRDCFQATLMRYFTEAVSDLQFQVNTELNETIYVDFEVDEHGFILITNFEESNAVLSEIENFNDLISERLNDLTTVKAAIYRGIKVAIRVRLPIVLNTQ